MSRDRCEKHFFLLSNRVVFFPSITFLPPPSDCSLFLQNILVYTTSFEPSKLHKKFAVTTLSTDRTAVFVFPSQRVLHLQCLLLFLLCHPFNSTCTTSKAHSFLVDFTSISLRIFANKSDYRDDFDRPTNRQNSQKLCKRNRSTNGFKISAIRHLQKHFAIDGWFCATNGIIPRTNTGGGEFAVVRQPPSPVCAPRSSV